MGRMLQQKIRAYLWRNVDDLLNPYFYVEVVIEFILSAFVLTIVVWALTTLNPTAYQPSTTHFGLFAGFVIMALLDGWGPLCGAAMNPTSVWGFFVAGRISFVRALFYMGAEIAGAAAGGMIGYSLTPPAQQETFLPILPGPGVTIGMGMAIEGILSFNHLVVALSVTDPARTTTTMMMRSFPAAFCIGTGILAAGSYTGGLQNPIVPFGPAVVTKNFSMHFEVYWAGAFIGATVGAVFYSLVITAKKHLDRSSSSIKEMPSVDQKTPRLNGSQSLTTLQTISGTEDSTI